MLLAQASTSLLKASEEGFQHWLIYAVCALFLYDKIAMIIQRRRAVSVEVVNRPAEYATKKALDEGLQALSLRVNLIESQQKDNLMTLMQTGHDRGEKLSTQINQSEQETRDMIAELKDQIFEKIDNSLKDAYQRINDHGERISGAEATIRGWRT